MKPQDVKWIVRVDQNTMDFCRTVEEVCFVVQNALNSDAEDIFGKTPSMFIVIERVNVAMTGQTEKTE